MATLAIWDGTVSDTFNFGPSNNPINAQGFKVAAGSVVDSVGIKGSRGNNATAGTFRIEIYEGGATPQAGTLIYTEDFNRTVLPAYTATPVMSTVTLTTPTASLTGGSTAYYLVLTALTGDANDMIRWSTDNAGTYPDGIRWLGNTAVPTWDMNFAIYGTTGGGGSPTPLLSLMGVGS